jgi:hypothetical protein
MVKARLYDLRTSGKAKGYVILIMRGGNERPERD